MVLVASFTVPANAVSWTVVNPADHISTSYCENGIDYVSFNFNLSPLIDYSLTGHSGETLTGSAHNSVSLDIDHSYHLPARFNIFPLGKKYSPASSLTSVDSGQIAVDVHDFKPSAAVTVNVNFYLHFDYVYDTAVDWSRYDTVGFTCYLRFYEYDANGNCLDVQVKTYEGNYDLIPQSTQATFSLPIQKSFEFSSMNEKTRYIVPYFYLSTYQNLDVADIELRNVAVSSKGFYIQTQTDMIKKDSLTLEAIEKHLEDLNDKTDVTNEKLDDLNDELGDLNDKADTVISGTPGMQQNADDALNFAQDQNEEANRVEELEKEYLDDYEASSDVLNDKVSLFVDGVGFTQLTALVAPIMNWKYSGLIMLLVIAFINMSVIMFGR